jgi:hypothetical protein
MDEVLRDAWCEGLPIGADAEVEKQAPAGIGGVGDEEGVGRAGKCGVPFDRGCEEGF